MTGRRLAAFVALVALATSGGAASADADVAPATSLSRTDALNDPVPVDTCSGDIYNYGVHYERDALAVSVQTYCGSHLQLSSGWYRAY